MWAKSRARYDPALTGAAEYDLVNSGLEEAASLARHLGSPVLLISHRNRVGQEKGGMHASKGSGAIEYESESIIDLTPKKDHAPDPMTGERGVVAEVAKNRHGISGVRVSLVFHGRLQEFKETDE